MSKLQMGPVGKTTIAIHITASMQTHGPAILADGGIVRASSKCCYTPCYEGDAVYVDGAYPDQAMLGEVFGRQISRSQLAPGGKHLFRILRQARFQFWRWRNLKSGAIPVQLR
jgi:hypothetical protein